MSEATARQLIEHSDMAVVPRRHMVEITNNGEMQTFWLEGYAPSCGEQPIRNSLNSQVENWAATAIESGSPRISTFSKPRSRSMSTDSQSLSDGHYKPRSASDGHGASDVDRDLLGQTRLRSISRNSKGGRSYAVEGIQGEFVKLSDLSWKMDGEV
eukprot:1176029-Prorocentrum_minimum.AAC.1